MRIKKKHIKENLDAKINNRVNKVKAAINQTAGDFEQMGIDGSEDLAADVVSSALDSSEDMNEDSVSDSQRRFFNAVHKCKVDGDCPSSEIKKAAEGMSLSDIEDFAFTKGELPDSVDEVASNNSYELLRYQELSDRVNNAKINGNNVALVKADRNKMYYHILDVIIDDDGIQFKGGISRSKDEITNPLLGSYNVTPENAHKMGPYALNIFNKVLDAAESNRILDVSDMKNPKMVDNGNIEEVNGDHFGDDEKLDIEVGADDYEEYQELLKNIGNHGKSIDLGSVEDGLPFESVRPKMTKSELTEAVKNIGENNKTPRKVVKTFKVKNLRNGKK